MSKKNYDVYMFGYFAGTLTLDSTKPLLEQVLEKLDSIGLNCMGELDIIDIMDEE
jgi:hypothetical protein